MELLAENGCSVSIARGCKKDLGRGSELAISDRTVSRHHVTVELLEPHAGHDATDGRLEVKVLGANPVCIMQTRKLVGMRGGDHHVVLLRKGEVDMLSPGDKFSLSLSHPMFIIVRGGRKQEDAMGSDCLKGSSSIAVAPLKGEMQEQLAEDDLLGKWRDHKKQQETRASCTNGGGGVGVGCSSPEKVAAANEEEGIAQAVARRQRRALERRLHKDREAGAESMSKVPCADAKPGEISVETDCFDRVKDFGFILEGSEFDQYKSRHGIRGGKWACPPLNRHGKSSDEQDSDDRQQEDVTSSRRKKVRREDVDDDNEWRGDDQDEAESVANAKKSKQSAKVNLRSHGPSSVSKVTVGRVHTASRTEVKRGRQEDDEYEDEGGEGEETLGGFIVNNDDEEVIANDDSNDEEEEACDDEDMDEADEEDEGDDDDCQDTPLQHKKVEEQQEKPLCKYGKSCYRKNKEHLSQYQH